jgi:hypothetical protein
MDKGEWYVIASGEHEGKWHMAGWMLSAHMGVSSGPGDDGWLGYANCPRCFAMVCSDRGPYGDLTWAHEQWHAQTDHPIPAPASAGVGIEHTGLGVCNRGRKHAPPCDYGNGV